MSLTMSVQQLVGRFRVKATWDSRSQHTQLPQYRQGELYYYATIVHIIISPLLQDVIIALYMYNPGYYRIRAKSP